MDANDIRVKKRVPPREDRISPGRHTDAGFPHLNSKNGACMCYNRCCMGVSGCLCRNCSHAGHAGCVKR